MAMQHVEHLQKMCQSLWEMSQKGHLCDVALQVEGGSVKAHQVLLAACSPVLSAILENTASPSCPRMICVESVKLADVLQLLQFMYLGTMQLSVETVDGVLSLSNQWKVTDAVVICKTFRESLKYQGHIQTLRYDSDISQSAQVKSNQQRYNETEYDESEKKNYNEDMATSFQIEELALHQDIGQSNTSQCTRQPFKLEIMLDSQSDLPKRQGPLTRRAAAAVKEKVASDDSVNTLVQHAQNRGKMQCHSAKNLSKNVSDGNNKKEKGHSGVKGNHRQRRCHRKCHRCHSQFNTTEELAVHRNECSVRQLHKPHKKRQKKSMKVPTKCRTCDLTFVTEEEWSKHRSEIHSDGKHMCDICTKTFVRSQGLVLHKYKEHYKEGIKEPNWHTCQEPGCKFRTVYSYSLQKHQMGHTDSWPFMCEVCGAKFKNKATLLHVHMKQHQGVDVGNEHLHECTRCHKTFATAIFLRSHQKRVHEKALQYLCDHCPYLGFTKTDLSHHLFQHHGMPLPGKKQGYNCPDCDYQTYSNYKLVTHRERHNEKSKMCRICQRTFSTQRDLHKHEQVHDKAPVMNKCPYEGCKFSCKIHYGPKRLQQHIAIMHEKRDYRPWACDMCEYCTNVKGNLTKHLRTVHQLQVQTKQKFVTKMLPKGEVDLSASQLQHTASSSGKGASLGTDLNPEDFTPKNPDNYTNRPGQENLVSPPSGQHQQYVESEPPGGNTIELQTVNFSPCGQEDQDKLVIVKDQRISQPLNQSAVHSSIKYQQDGGQREQPWTVLLESCGMEESEPT